MHAATEESRNNNDFDLRKSSLVYDRFEAFMALEVKVTVRGM
jgi:hypothetical protein